MKSDKQLIQKINSEVANFFGTRPIKPSIEIYDSWNELSKSWVNHSDGKESKAPEWLAAFATTKGLICILSPKVIPQGYEKNRRLRFNKTVRHELSHLYVDKINVNAPSWLKEGVCLYAANQTQNKKIDLTKISTTLLDELDYNFTDGRIYGVGKNIVDQIVENFGKQKLFEIIAIQDKNDRYTEMKKMFDWLKSLELH